MLKAKIMLHLFLVIIFKIKKKALFEGLMLITRNPEIRINFSSCGEQASIREIRR